MPESDVQQKIEARMAELPQDVQDAINDSDLDEKIRAVGQKFSLHVDQIGALGDEVMLAMLGFTPLAGLAGELVSQLSIDPVLAQSIVAEINDTIFVAIRESMKHFAESKTAAQPMVDTQPAAISAPVLKAPAVSTSPTPVPAPIPAPAVPAVIGPTTTVVPKPAAAPLSPELHEAEKMLSAPTVQVAPPAPTPATPAAAPDASVPPSYKADPYREPIE